VLAANQKGRNQHKVSQVGDLVIWTSEVGETRYYAGFNIGEIEADVEFPGERPLRNVWLKADLPGRAVRLAAHESIMVRER